MRKIQNLTLILLVLLISSCEKEDILLENNADVDTRANSSVNYTTGAPIYSNDELVIRYKLGTPEAIKQARRLANGITIEYTVEPESQQTQQPPGSYQKCSCGDRNIEKWKFPVPINIEPKKDHLEGSDIKSRHGIDNVDYEFQFKKEKLGAAILATTSLPYTDYIKPVNFGTTVAVLDTGIDTGLPVFNSSGADRFLYNSADTAGGVQVCNEISGWNFVNPGSNTYDDDPGHHGSIISFMVKKSLNIIGTGPADPDTAHQILPVKIADSEGRIKYFHATCGLSFAVQKAKVVNASFGWHDDGFGDFDNTIFNDIIGENDDVFVVASAGNKNKGSHEVNHYPSYYHGVISVGACNENLTQVSGFTNYGDGVDLYAKGEMPFGPEDIKGTSFAAAQVTAVVARILNENLYDPGLGLSMAEVVSTYGTITPLGFTTIENPEEPGVFINKNSLYNRYLENISDLGF